LVGRSCNERLNLGRTHEEENSGFEIHRSLSALSPIAVPVQRCLRNYCMGVKLAGKRPAAGVSRAWG